MQSYTGFPGLNQVTHSQSPRQEIIPDDELVDGTYRMFAHEVSVELKQMTDHTLRWWVKYDPTGVWTGEVIQLDPDRELVMIDEPSNPESGTAQQQIAVDHELIRPSHACLFVPDRTFGVARVDTHAIFFWPQQSRTTGRSVWLSHQTDVTAGANWDYATDAPVVLKQTILEKDEEETEEKDEEETEETLEISGKILRSHRFIQGGGLSYFEMPPSNVTTATTMITQFVRCNDTEEETEVV
jgi:hypothetical protein